MAEQFESNLVLLTIVFSLTGATFVQWLFRIPVQTMLIINLIVFLGVGMYTIPRIRRQVKTLNRLRQARDGEHAVAEYLDLLREDGCRVLHDIVGDNFNVDHAVIAPQGIYTIETNTDLL